MQYYREGFIGERNLYKICLKCAKELWVESIVDFNGGSRYRARVCKYLN